MNNIYYNGIQENLDGMNTFYPGWTMRLHVDQRKMEKETQEKLCRLQCQDSRLDLCPVNNLPMFGDISRVMGMTWRFLPLVDPDVDVMVSRDLDSRVTLREQAAVNQWISSNLPFHTMRDHPDHQVEIMGGMWGARMDLGQRKLFSNLTQFLIDDAGYIGWYRGVDQAVLSRWVWPRVANMTMSHDSYQCKKYVVRNWRPWPTQRLPGPFNHVGSAGPMELTAQCPQECRPPDNKDWVLC